MITLIEAVSETLAHISHELIPASTRDQSRWFKARLGHAPELVTSIDTAIERLLREVLLGAYPGVPYCGEEESPEMLSAIEDDILLVDPIDGSSSLAAGNETYTISIARVTRGQAVESVCHFPAWNVTLHRNGGPTQVEGQPPDLAFGPSSMLISPGETNRVRRHFQDSPLPDLIEVPTASVKLGLVAMGLASSALYLPGCARPGAMAWDYAAAAHVLAGAGGTVVDDHSCPLGQRVLPKIAGWLAVGRIPPPGDLIASWSAHSCAAISATHLKLSHSTESP